MTVLRSKSAIKGLTTTQLKTIAIVAMLIDHIASSFIASNTVAGQIMHIIGRLTAPIMCFFIAQGYIHTGSLKKYFMRMILFTLISHVPYVLKSTGEIGLMPFSVIYTLTLGLLAIYVYDKMNNNTLKWLAIIGIGILAIPGDWAFFGIAFCLIFHIHRNDFKKQCIGLICVGISELILMGLAAFAMKQDVANIIISNLYQLAIILSLPLLYLYNGKKGGNSFSRWGFYIFYPLHLLVLALIKIYIV